MLASVLKCGGGFELLLQSLIITITWLSELKMPPLTLVSHLPAASHPETPSDVLSPSLSSSSGHCPVATRPVDVDR